MFKATNISGKFWIERSKVLGFQGSRAYGVVKDGGKFAVGMRGVPSSWRTMGAAKQIAEVGLPGPKYEWVRVYDSVEEAREAGIRGRRAMNDRQAAQELVAAAKELTAKEKRIDIIRRIVKEHQHEKIDGYVVDATTANLLLKVHDALKPELQKKFDKIPLKKLVDFAWSVVK